MSAHTREQREFIVLRLARFDLPSEIIAAFADQWRDTLCTATDIAICDPGRGAVIAPELFAAFLAERARVLVDPTAAPTSNRQVRLIRLHRLQERAADNNQVDLAARLLSQIALDSDGVDTSPDASQVKRITRTIVDPEKKE